MRNDQLGYPIIVGPGALGAVSDLVSERHIERSIILCDRNIEPYAHAVAKMIQGTLDVVPVRLGERRKRWETAGAILEHLAKSGADRTTLVIGLGGGVAGDVFGFTASVFMRGVPFLNVATSLVAMVDAAIGGKTGVDLEAGKNLAGTFNDPSAVVCDTGLLATLPKAQMREGMAEVIKHAVIEGDRLFTRLERLDGKPRGWPWDEIVSDSIAVKTKIVASDRLEQGKRALLNLGHTTAHGIERASEYGISHGHAVAIGLRAAGLMALALGEYSYADHRRVLNLLQRNKLPLHYSKIDPEAIVRALHFDKKRKGGEVRFVLPRAIGNVTFDRTVPAQIVRLAVERCGAPPGPEEIA